MSIVLFGIGAGFALAAVFFAVACWLDAGARRQCTRDGHDFVNERGRGFVCTRCFFRLDYVADASHNERRF